MPGRDRGMRRPQCPSFTMENIYELPKYPNVPIGQEDPTERG